MDKYNILIFPAGTEIALEIYNALKYDKYITLFGGSSVPCHGELVFKNYIEGFPFINDNNFIEYLNKIIEQNRIDFIYPAYDDVCLFLTQKQDKINAKVVTSPLETVEICRSKNKTYEFLKNEDYIPKYYLCKNEVKEYPIFVKPSVGQGSQGIFVVNSKEELERITKNNKEYTICEYLPGEEYTIDCFTDKNGKLRACYQRTRERVKSGISVRSTLLTVDDKVKQIAESINSKLVFNGAWFFQLKRDVNNNYKLLEIAPRIPGTMSVSRNIGINFPLLTIYNMIGLDIDLIENNYKVLVDRSLINRFKTDIEYDKVYLDFDDTVYIKDKVNIQLIMFLYQCVNNNKEIILLTKHDGDLDEYLDKYKISRSLFNRIIHIGKDEEKYRYITNNSIFIDDSFAERKKIKEKNNIPVFDLNMIESLIDWRI